MGKRAGDQRTKPELVSTYKWKRPGTHAFNPGSSRESDTFYVYKMPDGMYRTVTEKLEEEMAVRMFGTLNKPGHGKQRGIFLLLQLRAAMGWALEEDPDPDELGERESVLRRWARWTKRPEAHDEDEILAAITKMARMFMADPESVRGSSKDPVLREPKNMETEPDDEDD
jgi:hypothetical protein